MQHDELLKLTRLAASLAEKRRRFAKLEELKAELSAESFAKYEQDARAALVAEETGYTDLRGSAEAYRERLTADLAKHRQDKQNTAVRLSELEQLAKSGAITQSEYKERKNAAEKQVKDQTKLEESAREELAYVETCLAAPHGMTDREVRRAIRHAEAAGSEGPATRQMEAAAEPAPPAATQSKSTAEPAAKPSGKPKRGLLIIGIVVGLVVVLGVLAFVLRRPLSLVVYRMGTSAEEVPAAADAALERALEGDLESAAESLQTLVAAYPEATEEALELVGVLVLSGRYEEAAEEIEKILTREPENSEALAWLAYIQPEEDE